MGMEQSMSDIDPDYAIPGFRATEPKSKPFELPCRYCDLANDERCKDAPCMPHKRPDKQFVIMKAIKPSEETK